MDWVKRKEITKEEAEKLLGRILDDNVQELYTDGRFVQWQDDETIYEVDLLLKEERHTLEYLGCGWSKWVAC